MLNNVNKCQQMSTLLYQQTQLAKKDGKPVQSHNTNSQASLDA